MILEHALLSVDPRRIDAFEAAFVEARTLPSQIDGFIDLQLWRSVEEPGRYRLLIHWESVAAHTEGFVGSAAFHRWRELMTPFSVAPTQVDHLEQVN